MSRILCLAGLLGLACAGLAGAAGQEPSPGGAAGGGLLSIKNINQACTDEVCRNEALKTRYGEILRRYRQASRTALVERRLQDYLKLRHELADLARGISDARSSQLQLLMLIDQIGKGRELLPQEVPYVLDNRNKVAGLGRNQQVMLAVVRKVERRIDQDIRSMPLPREYTNGFGIRMVLVQPPRKPAFYVAAEPLRWKALPKAVAGSLKPPAGAGEFVCGISHRQARAVCQAMQLEEEGYDYRLPTYEELKHLDRMGFKAPIGVWSQSLWTADWQEEECCKRFGISMMTVWDPGLTMHKRESAHFFPELPAAVHPGLGMTVVSSGRSGRSSRFRRIRQEVEGGLQPKTEGPREAQAAPGPGAREDGR